MSEEILEQNEKGHCPEHVHLSLNPGMVSAFVELLQNGFLFKCQIGANVKSFLCEGLGLNGQYVSERISTIFLDGKCVDNIDSAIVKESSTVALSAAMPGLAGATLRRGGVYASMRGPITHRENGQGQEGAGLCTVKLFNLLIKDLGPVFLRRGILIRPDKMESFLMKKSDEFWQRCRQISFEGRLVDRDSLLENCRRCQEDFLLLTATMET
jgi:hypothetical protein